MKTQQSTIVSTQQIREFLCQGRTLDEISAFFDIPLEDVEQLAATINIKSYTEDSLEKLEAQFRIDALRVLHSIMMDSSEENTSARVNAAKTIYVGRTEQDLDEKAKVVEKLLTLREEMQIRVKADLDKALGKNITPQSDAEKSSANNITTITLSKN